MRITAILSFLFVLASSPALAAISLDECVDQIASFQTFADTLADEQRDALLQEVAQAELACQLDDLEAGELFLTRAQQARNGVAPHLRTPIILE